MTYQNFLSCLCFTLALFVLPSLILAQDPTEQRKPDSVPLLIEIIASIPEISEFHSAIERSNLDLFLQGTGPFTVFAPSNVYFENLDETSRNLLFADKNQLTEFVRSHIILGRLPLADVFKLRHLPMLTGQIREAILGPIEGVDGYPFSQTDITAKNGIIHIVNVPTGIVAMPEESQEIAQHAE